MAEEETPETPLERKYPGNSKKDKEEEERPKLDPVVTGKVIQRKKSIVKRVTETFAGEGVENVGQFLVVDVIVPAIKTLLADIASQGVERMLFGEVSRRSTTARPGNGGRYTSYSRMSETPSRREMSQRARATHDFRDIILDTRVEAEEVLTELDRLIRQYDVASVSDLYQLTDLDPSWTDNKWGWTDLSTADIRRVREGYMLILPRAVQID